MILAGSIPSSLPSDIYQRIMDKLRNKDVKIVVETTKDYRYAFHMAVAAGVTLLAVSIGSLPLCIAGLCLTGMSYGACPTINKSHNKN